jgi:hypothetical protein
MIFDFSALISMSIHTIYRSTDLISKSLKHIPLQLTDSVTVYSNLPESMSVSSGVKISILVVMILLRVFIPFLKKHDIIQAKKA